MNRVVVIGGSRGIGGAFVDRCERASCTVLSVGRSRTGLRSQLVDELQLDLLDSSGLAECVRQVSAFEPTLVVYAAGAFFERHAITELGMERNLHLHCLVPHRLLGCLRRDQPSCVFLYVGSMAPTVMRSRFTATEPASYDPLLAYTFSKASAVHALAATGSSAKTLFFFPGSTRTDFGLKHGPKGNLIWALNRFGRSPEGVATDIHSLCSSGGAAKHQRHSLDAILSIRERLAQEDISRVLTCIQHANHSIETLAL